MDVPGIKKRNCIIPNEKVDVANEMLTKCAYKRNSSDFVYFIRERVCVECYTM